MFRKLHSIWRYLRNREPMENELDAELRYHVDRQTDENLRAGMSAGAARRAARISVGEMGQLKDASRDARTGRAIEIVLQDIRYGIRVLRKNPGFTLMALCTLALGIGANTAVFSVVYGVLLRPLPYQSGSRLVVLHQEALRASVPDFPFSVKEVVDYRERSRTLDSVVEYHSMVFLLLGDETAQRVQTGVVSANFFDVLGVQPLKGRTFVVGDETPGGNPVLILSYKYWQTSQHGDPNIVGKAFRMNNRTHTVIGVLPPVPQYPAENDVYMPTSQCPFRSSARFIADPQARMMTAFGRLRPGVTLAQARADLSVVAGQLKAEHPDVYPDSTGYGLRTEALHDELTRRARLTFLVLLSAAGLVLLIACANVGNLLLARAVRAEREMAVRAALGASRARLVRQMLTESVLVSMAGGLLGVALTPFALKLLVSFAERLTTRAAEVRLDAPVLLFSFAISVLTGLVFGLIPALSGSRHISEALSQGGSRAATTGRGGQTLRAGLVIGQVAVSFVLLIGAGLMIRSFARLQQINPGFSTERLLSLRISPSFTRYNTPVQQHQLWERIAREVGSIGGVESAAVSSRIPFGPDGIANGPHNSTFEIEGRPNTKGAVAATVDTVFVGPGYFETIRQPVLKGRAITLRDDADAEQVAVINQTMARNRWPNEEPLGRRITFDQGAHWARIVGVAGDAKEYGLAQPTGDEIYLPVVQGGFAGGMVVRTLLPPSNLAPQIRAAIQKLDSQIAVDSVETVEQLQYDSEATPRVTTILLGIFAGLAMLISACGIAAVMALTVSQRTHELGIRMALGAQRSQIVGVVVLQGFLLALTGVAIGSVASFMFSRILTSLLFATSTADGVTFLVVTGVFLTVAAVASFVPARRVTSIDPLIALREE